MMEAITVLTFHPLAEFPSTHFETAGLDEPYLLSDPILVLLDSGEVCTTRFSMSFDNHRPEFGDFEAELGGNVIAWSYPVSKYDVNYIRECIHGK